MSAILLGLTTSFLSISKVSAKDTIAFEYDYIWDALKVGMACSPIIAIVLILACAREDDEEEIAKRKIKCAKS